MRPDQVVEDVKNRVSELLGADHADEVQLLFDKIDDAVELLSDQCEEQSEAAYQRGVDSNNNADLLAAVKEFAIWHSQSYASERDRLRPDVSDGVSTSLWSQIVSIAGPSADLPAYLAGMRS